VPERRPSTDPSSQRVRIRRQFNDPMVAECPTSALQDFCWDVISGGVKARAPQWFLFAFVDCTEVIGDIAHSCQHGSAPHSIKVCVVKIDNDPETYAALAEKAGPRPPSKRSCGDDALALVAEHGAMRGPDLRKKLERREHSRYRISVVLPELERRGRLISTVGPRRAKTYRLPNDRA